MSATVDLTLDDLYTVVGTFVQTALGMQGSPPALVPIIVGNPNRVPAPPVTTTGAPVIGYVVMQGFRAGRVRTNQDTYDTVNQVQVIEKGTKVRIQFDFYGPVSENWATIIEALWRDYYGCDQLKPTCQPLYSDEAMQMALVDGEQQYEERWTMDAYLQYNPSVTFTQQSATALAVTVINVDERYSP